MDKSVFEDGLTQPLSNKPHADSMETLIGFLVSGRLFLDSAILAQYCFCDLHQQKEVTMQVQSVEQSCKPASLKKKRRALEKFNFTQKVRELSNMMLVFPDNHGEVVIHAKQKTAARNLNSTRRSRYIGVFKNGSSWQALISINKAKTYIGTFKTESAAAHAFDFHSIALHGLMAVTNFDYTKGEIMEMVMNYQSNEGKFIPST